MSHENDHWRTKNYRESLALALTLGKVTEAEIEANCQKSNDEDNALDAGRCPACGEVLQRGIDGGGGPSQMPGQWVKYRCKPGCGKTYDRVEEFTAEGSN
jgi:hypothetical protein